MNVRSIIEEIQSRVERESRPSRSGPNVRDSDAVESELAALHDAYGRLYEIRNLVGQMPPSPGTLRARIGAHLVRLVQRMLFWYTPQILRFHNESAKTIGAMTALIERQSEMIAVLQKEMKALRAASVMASVPATQPVLSERQPVAASFEFSVQDRFRGSELDTSEKLLGWFEAITDAAGPADLSRRWLDLGCGRGEWLSIVARHGHAATGIDANPVAVAHCNESGWNAECAGAMEYLSAISDESLAVVTAFHVLEHLPMDYLRSLLPLIACKLQPGGILAIETPDPANLLMSSRDFWKDPTHHRPIPVELMELLFEHSGFEVVRRLHLNPAPPEEHLPFTEIEPVRRVDDLLYGCRDYGLIGRK